MKIFSRPSFKAIPDCKIILTFFSRERGDLWPTLSTVLSIGRLYVFEYEYIKVVHAIFALSGSFGLFFLVRDYNTVTSFNFLERSGKKFSQTSQTSDCSDAYR